MDVHQVLGDVKDLGPALASILAIGVIVYFFIGLFKELLGMFKSHAEALNVINDNMRNNTEATREMHHAVRSMNDSVRENTKITERVTFAIDKHINSSL